MGERYLRTIFKFFGITDFTTLSIDNLDGNSEKVPELIEQAKQQAKELAPTF